MRASDAALTRVAREAVSAAGASEASDLSVTGISPGHYCNFMPRVGLSRVSLRELRRMLTAVHRDVLVFPLRRSGLIASGFGDVEEHLGLLLGLEKIAVQRVLVAVIAERTRLQVAKSAP